MTISVLTAARPTPENDPAARLVAAAAALISQDGAASASARRVAAAAGVAPSAVNYHFGDAAGLIDHAFAHGFERMSGWAEQRLAELRELNPGPTAAAATLEHLIVAWTRGQTPLAFLYQEARLHREPPPSALRWREAWREYWGEVAAVLALEPTAAAGLHALFESEALFHLADWRALIDHAALRELCAHFAALFLGQPPAPAVGAVALARRLLVDTQAPPASPAAERIAAAAVAVIGEGGLDALTHRRVAARAGLTPGAVTHHFATVEALLAAAVRLQRGRLEAEARQAVLTDAAAQPFSPEGFFRALGGGTAPQAAAARLRALLSLSLAASRRPEMVSAAASARYSFGATTARALRTIAGYDQTHLLLDSSLLSRMLSAQWPAWGSEGAARAFEDFARDSLTTIVRRRA